jgi:periplasmic protein CpxP/Spy
MSIRRIAIIVVPVLGLATLGVVMAAGAAVRHGAPFCHGPRSMEDRRAHVEMIVGHVLDRVDATDEQQAQIDAILADAHAEMEEGRADREERHEEIKDLLSMETVDRAALETVRLEAVDHFEEVSQLGVQVIGDVCDVLTAEQRAELIDLVESYHNE